MEIKKEGNKKAWGQCWDKLRKWGKAIKEKTPRGKGSRETSMDVPPNSLLGIKLARWAHNPETKRLQVKSK